MQEKSKFNRTSVKYMDLIISSQGVDPDTFKTKAIIKMFKPNSKQDVQRFLEKLTCVTKFVKNLLQKFQFLKNCYMK